MRTLTHLAAVVPALISAASFAAEPQPRSHPANTDFDSLRGSYLRDIHVLRDYRPGKNSFVEGPDRRPGRYAGPGERLTLLDVKGRGSVSHLLSTWAPGKGNHRLEFFVDGAKQPAMAGTPDELIAKVRQMPSPPVPVPGFIGQHGARNLFLPVEFRRAMRIEMETLEPTWLIFYQIDYRLGEKRPLNVGGASAPRPSVRDAGEDKKAGGVGALRPLPHSSTIAAGGSSS
ncbi:MAG: hypothetical protein HZA91_12050, partial [Verrucomicrobia bacterium]|nr:hypothetical protein [Verrucomicrobiota bacterium]